MSRLLSPTSIARILQSLITAEVKALRERAPGSELPGENAAGLWRFDLSLRDDKAAGLGLDSLELMAVGAAINEMFHLYESPTSLDLGEMVSFGDWVGAVEAAWDHGVSKITFLTSGSTGVAKRCVHDAALLAEEVRFLAALFSSRRRIIALAPSHHIYGCLLTAFLADRLGVDVVSASTCSPRFLNTELVAGDLIVSFPERWDALNRTVSSWPPDVEGVVSTAPCPPQLITSLQESGLAGLTELYGSTETAGIGWRRPMIESRFTLMPHWEFNEPDNEAPGHYPLRRKGGCVHQAPDALTKLNAREFTVGCRRDGGVQIGGINVWPLRVASELERHPKVKAASVRLQTTTSGARLKAFIVPVSSEIDINLRQELEQWCKQRFAAVECPRSWTFGPNLPRTEFGKLADWGPAAD